MGVLEFLVPFYPISTAKVVFSSDLEIDPLNLYPILGWEVFLLIGPNITFTRMGTVFAYRAGSTFTRTGSVPANRDG